MLSTLVCVIHRLKGGSAIANTAIRSMIKYSNVSLFKIFRGKARFTYQVQN